MTTKSTVCWHWTTPDGAVSVHHKGGGDLGQPRAVCIFVDTRPPPDGAVSVHHEEGGHLTSVSEWKYTITSAFKFKLLRQHEAAGCSPDHNGRKLAASDGYFYSGCSPDHNSLGYSQLGGD